MRRGIDHASESQQAPLVDGVFADAEVNEVGRMKTGTQPPGLDFHPPCRGDAIASPISRPRLLLQHDNKRIELSLPW